MSLRAASPVSGIDNYSLQVPLTGFTITIANGITDLVLNPAGGLATGTVTMPAVPFDGQRVNIVSTQAVTTFTLNGNSGQTVTSAPGALVANVAVTFIYIKSATNWFRLS
jgi:hypothetical protein